jgi:hypothetical protein
MDRLAEDAPTAAGRCASLPLRLVPAILTAAAVAIFSVGAFRGFELTDESFYLLHYLHSRDFTSGLTFFGLYLELPFQLLGGSIGGIRIFGLLALGGASYFFMKRLYEGHALQVDCRRADRVAFLAAGLAVTFLFYSYFGTLRAPSYNTLALAAMLVATGALLAILASPGPQWDPYVAALLYGLACSVCLVVKPPAAVLATLAHALFFAAYRQRSGALRLSGLLAFAAVGFAANIALVQFAMPNWLELVRRGLEGASVTDHGDLLVTLRVFGWDIQRDLAARWPTYAATAVFYGGALAIFQHLRPASIGSLVAALTALLACWIVGSANGSSLYPSVGLIVALLLATGSVGAGTNKAPAFDLAFVGLLALLFFLPIAFSLGTNNPIAGHSRMAFVFPLAGCLLALQRLHARGVVARRPYLISLGAICLPALWLQTTPWLDGTATYRLRAPLSEQRYPVAVGPQRASLMVDAVTRDDLSALQALMASAGFRPGMPLIDLSGDGVGYVYAAGGVPVGVAWHLGGFSGSAKLLSDILGTCDPQILSQAWIFSSADNPRRIDGWEDAWQQRVGALDLRPIGSVCLGKPYRFDASPTKGCYDLTIWKPSPKGN